MAFELLYISGMQFIQILILVIGGIFALSKFLRKRRESQQPQTVTAPSSQRFDPPATTKSFEELLSELRFHLPGNTDSPKENKKYLDDAAIDQLLELSNNDLGEAVKRAKDLHEKPEVVASGRFQEYAVRQKKADPIKKHLKNKGQLKRAIILSELLNPRHF